MKQLESQLAGVATGVKAVATASESINKASDTKCS